MQQVFDNIPYPGQKRILILSWLAYALAYTLRVNIAVVIPYLVAAKNYSYTQMGLVTSLFFATYMFGQLINGFLGDRIDNKLMIIAGLLISAACNLGMAETSHYSLILVIWGINGFAQSMLWAPLMKTLSVWFSGFQLEKVSFIMAQTMIFGYAFSWGGSAYLSSRFGYAAAFYVPTAVVAVFIVVMLLFFSSEPVRQLKYKNHPEMENQPESALNSGSSSTDIHKLSTGAYFRLIQLGGLLLIAICQGFIREGIGVWFPTILKETAPWAATTSWIVLIVVPFINFFGILFVRKVNLRTNGNSFRTLLILYSLISAVAFILLVMVNRQVFLVLLIMALLLAITHGMTPILTSVIPFQYARFRKVSLTVGILDFAIYLGAAISSMITGLIADRYAWNGVMALWLGAAVLGLASTGFRFIKNKGQQQHTEKIH